MRRSALLLCLVAGACSGGESDPRGVGRDEVLVQLVATGRTDTRPDEARFSVGVETFGPSAAAASAQNAEAINRVVAALTRLGIKPDDVQTRSIQLGRVDYGPNKGRFQASNAVEIRVREMARAGEAIAAATDAGANLLSGPSLRIGDPEATGRSAYAAAYRAARARADAYAEAAGLKVVRVLTIRDSGAGGMPHPYPPPEEGAMDARAVAPPVVAPPPVQPGMTTREVQIRVDFALAK